MYVITLLFLEYENNFSHIRSLGAAGALAVDICICFHDTESYILEKKNPFIGGRECLQKLQLLTKNKKKLKKIVTNLGCIHGLSCV